MRKEKKTKKHTQTHWEEQCTYTKKDFPIELNAAILEAFWI